GFLWQGLARPLQVVQRGVGLPWREEDLRSVPPADPDELPERLARLAAAELARGFDPGRPPLLAAALARTGEEEPRFVWPFHHLLFDGWCFSLLFRDLFALYAAELSGESAPLPPVRPYRDYLAWLAQRDGAVDERYWRGVLAGFAAPTPLPLDAPRALPGASSSDLEVLLSPALTAALAARARALGLTLNTLFHGGWGLLP